MGSVANVALTVWLQLGGLMLSIFRRFDWIVAGCFAVLLATVVWHIQEGPRGFGYQDSLLAKQAMLVGEVSKLQKRNADFEARVRLLRPESIDPDLIDELARRDLALGRPNDRLIVVPQ